MECDGEAPGEEGEKVKSPKRKVIRVESEETQDYVRKAKHLNQEEADAVKRPSVSGSLFRWWTNLCQQCYNEKRR